MFVPGVVPFSSDEPVGRYPTVFTTPGTSSSRKQKGGNKHKQNENVRTVRLRLLPNGAQERKLWRIGDTTAKLWNELNYVRLVQYRESGMVDFEGTGHEFYHKYKNVFALKSQIKI